SIRTAMRSVSTRTPSQSKMTIPSASVTCRLYPNAEDPGGHGILDNPPLLSYQGRVPVPSASKEGGSMRRSGILLLAVFGPLVMAGPVAAQPKVTITGFIDQVSSWTNN